MNGRRIIPNPNNDTRSPVVGLVRYVIPPDSWPCPPVPVLLPLPPHPVVASTAAEAAARFGQIDILVSNAGVCRLGGFLEASEEDRDYHLDVNVKGAWNICHAVLPYMKERQYGRVIIMSSVTGYMVADPGEAGYAMSKAALIGLTKALAREFAQDGITVNAICPGYVDTPMVQGIALQSDADDPQSVKQGIADATPLGRLADPQEVGDLAAFLGSDESRYITGTQIVIDGGSTLPETISVGA